MKKILYTCMVLFSSLVTCFFLVLSPEASNTPPPSFVLQFSDVEVIQGGGFYQIPNWVSDVTVEGEKNNYTASQFTFDAMPSNAFKTSLSSDYLGRLNFELNADFSGDILVKVFLSEVDIGLGEPRKSEAKILKIKSIATPLDSSIYDEETFQKNLSKVLSNLKASSNAQDVEKIFNEVMALIEKSPNKKQTLGAVLTSAKQYQLLNRTVQKDFQCIYAFQNLCTKAAENISAFKIYAYFVQNEATAHFKDSDLALISSELKQLQDNLYTLNQSLQDLGISLRMQPYVQLVAMDLWQNASIRTFLLNNYAVGELFDKKIENLMLTNAHANIVLKEDSTNYYGSVLKIETKVPAKSEIPADVAVASQQKAVLQLTFFEDEAKIPVLHHAIGISMPLHTKDVQNINDLSVYSFEENGKQRNLAGHHLPLLQRISFITDTPSLFFIRQNTVRFSDLASNHWAKLQIDSLASRAILSGTGNNQFQPAKPVTRAEFVSMLVHALRLNQPWAISELSDLEASAWYYNPVANAIKFGLVHGDHMHHFRPMASITRQDVGVILANTLTRLAKVPKNYDAKQVLSSFIDADSISDYAKEPNALITSLQIMQGKPSDRGIKFEPKLNTTRAEAAIVIYKIMSLLNNQGFSYAKSLD